MNKKIARQYYCNKCGVEIAKKKRHTYYKYNSKACVTTKDFELCTTCNNELRNWLENKYISTTQQLINSFPIFLEQKENRYAKIRNT